MDKKERKLRRGPAAQKVLLLLNAGLSLLTSGRPGQKAWVLRSAAKEWEQINRRVLRDTIRRLYQSKLIDVREDSEGNVQMTLSRKGKEEALRYKVDEMKISEPARWDKKWHFVMFDIPEHFKQARNAVRQKLTELGFYQYQKSVFVHPFPCEDEVDFIVELFELRPYTRMMLATEIDNELHIKNHFGL